LLDTGSVRWIFFDVGDTLVDESVPIRDSIGQFLRHAGKLGYAFTENQVLEQLTHYYNLHTERPMKAVMERLVENKAHIGHIRGLMAYQKQLEKPFPAAASVLASLAGRYKLGVIANQSPGTASRLERYGLLRYIEVVCASAEAGFEKPDIRLFRLALEEAGCSPEQAVMVGDRIDNDIVPAKRIGMKAVWVRQGLARSQPFLDPERPPDAVVDRLDEIVALFGS
jgi:HAD superfamily hydrolase (TIGR01662 family)